MPNRSARSTIPRSRRTSGFSPNLLSDDLNKQALGWVRLWSVPSLLQKITLRRNPLLRTTIARWRETERCLELGPRFFRLTKRRDEILCHELAHAAALQIHGRGIAPHGPEWHALVNAAGYSPSSVLKTSRPNLALNTPKSRWWYEHRCTVCHSVRYARKRMCQWRCAECNRLGLPGLLIITRLEERP
jgi:predicted SprT family Zn-dependent metalloprotease